MVAGSAHMQTVTWFEPTDKVIQTAQSKRWGNFCPPWPPYVWHSGPFFSFPPCACAKLTRLFAQHHVIWLYKYKGSIPKNSLIKWPRIRHHQLNLINYIHLPNFHYFCPHAYNLHVLSLYNCYLYIQILSCSDSIIPDTKTMINNNNVCLVPS